MGIKGLDDYITGVHAGYNDMVKHVCPKCKAVKEVAMNYDMGGWFYDNDDDPFCDKCQVEMTVLEV